MFSVFSKKKINKFSLKDILSLSIPIIFTNMMVPISGIIDTIIAGKFGIDAIGAIAIGAIAFSIIYSCCSFIKMTTTALIAQESGKKNESEIYNIGFKAFSISTLIGLAIFFLKDEISFSILYLFKPTEIVGALSNEYITLRSISSPFYLIIITGSGWFIGKKEIKKVVFLQFLMCLINITLSFFLGIKMGLGIKGIAIATVFSEVITALLTLFLFYISNKHRQIKFASLIDKKSNLIFFNANLNIFIRTVLLIFAISLITALGGRISKEILAINAILFHFQSFLSYGMDGVANATEVLIGKSIGEKNKDKYKEYILYSSILAIILSLIYFLIYFLICSYVFNFFSSDKLFLSQLSNYKIWIIISPLVSVFCFQLDGIYLGALQSRMMRNSMMISFLIYIVSLYFLLPLYGNHGIWLSFMIFLIMRSLTLLANYSSLLKKVFNN